MMLSIMLTLIHLNQKQLSTRCVLLCAVTMEMS